MLILGIDPGLAIVGYSLVEKKAHRFSVCDYGVIRTPAEASNCQRLMTIFEELSNLIATYQPDEMAVEELFLIKT